MGWSGSGASSSLPLSWLKSLNSANPLCLLAGRQRSVGMEGASAECVRAEPFHRVTPLLESWALSQVAGMPVFLKYENVQIAGSFKIRGIGHFCQQVKEGGHTAVEEVWAPY